MLLCDVNSILSNLFFGDGYDGDIVVSETITLNKDMYYNKLTTTETGSIKTNGWKIFVADTLDLSNASAYAINANGINGSNANGITGGSGGNALNSFTVGGSGGIGELIKLSL